MPINNEDFHTSLYDLLRTKGYDPIPLDSKGNTTPFYPEADIFKFSFVKNGKKYGDVWATVDNALKLVLYYDDDVSSSSDDNTSGTPYSDSWPALIKHLKKWAQRRQLSFELKNKDHLVSDMAQREYMKKKERLGEGYYPMGKKASYNDAIPQVKIVIQHTKQIGEGEQRFRNVDRIFVENTEGERFAVPTKKPGLAKVYARHVAEGGTPYDDRGRHLTTLIEEYNKMVGFVRATKTGEFNESVQRVVNAGIDHYQSLRESLGKLTSHRGYHSYFDSWSPVLNEEQSDITEISTLFTKSNLDPRIESCIPILSKLTKLDEIKPVKELDSWADEVIRETTSIDLSKEGPTSLMPGAGKNTRTSRERDRERAKALSHYSKELAADHYGKELEKSDQGVTEGQAPTFIVIDIKTGKSVGTFRYGAGYKPSPNAAAAGYKPGPTAPNGTKVDYNQQVSEQGVAEGYDMLWIVYRQDTTLYPNGERDHETKVVKTFNNDREAEDYANKLNAANRDDDVYYFVRGKKQGMAEGYHNNVMHAWNSGMSDEEIIQRFGKSEFDRLKKKYGDGSIPVQDLLGLRSKEPEDKRVRLHRGLEGPGKALKSIIKQQNQKQGVTEGLDPDTQRLEQEVRDALANGDDYTAKSFAKMARTAADRNYLRKIIRQEMYGTGPGQGGVAEGDTLDTGPDGKLTANGEEQMRRYRQEQREQQRQQIIAKHTKTVKGGAYGVAPSRISQSRNEVDWAACNKELRKKGLDEQGVTEGSKDKVHLKTPKHGLADHPGRNTGVGLRTFASTPEQDRCSKCNTLYKNHYQKQGAAEGSEDLVQIEYWKQDSIEAGRWVKTQPMPREVAEELLHSHPGAFSRGEIVDVKQGVAEGSADMEWHGSNTDMKWYDAYKDQPVRVKVKNHSGRGGNPSGTFKIRSFKKIGPSKAELTITFRGEEMTGTVDLDNPETVVNKMYDKVPAMNFYIGSMPATARQAFNLFQYKNKKQGVTEGDVVQGPWGRKPTLKPEVGGTGTSTADQEPSGLRQVLQDKYSRFDNITITWQSKDQMAQEVEWEEGEGFPPNLIGEFEVKFEEESDEGYTMEVTDTWSVKSKNLNGRAPYELKRRARISAEMESLNPHKKGVVESRDEDSYIERRRARKYGYDTGLEREYMDLDAHERAMAARAAKEKEKTSSKDDKDQGDQIDEGVMDFLKKVGLATAIVGALGLPGAIEMHYLEQTPLVQEIKRRAEQGDEQAKIDLYNLSVTLGSGRTGPTMVLLNRYGFKNVQEPKSQEGETYEGLNAQQKKAGQLGPTEKAKNISPVLGSPQHKHPFDGKLVGNESTDPDLKRLQTLIKHIR